MYGFLSRVYNQKCDHPEIKRYYVAKHELQFAPSLSSSLDYARGEEPVRRDVERTLQALEEFDRSLISGEYSDFVGLSDTKVDVIAEGTPLVASYVESTSEGKTDPIARAAILDWVGRVLGGLAHLSYGATFETTSSRHQANVRRSHKEKADEILADVGRDVERLAEVVPG